MAAWKSCIRRGVAALWLGLLAQSAQAVSLIRDADIENGLAELARPLIQAAGLSPSRMQILLVNDRQMNAFVIDGGHVFVNAGLILRLETAAELQSVIAHELAHIANGHIARRESQLGTARTTSSIGFLLAVAAAAAGAPDAAQGIALGVSGSAQGVLLAHSRAEEASADGSAVRYMARAEVDPRAALDVLELFRGQEALSARQQDVYVRSHPLTADRIRAIEAAAAGVTQFPASSASDEAFLRLKTKLSAFMNAPTTTLRQFPKKDKSYIAEMARAVAYHRKPDPKAARAHIDRAIALEPEDGYLYDLKGQILLESRDFKGAVAAYGKANALLPKTPQILAGLGRAYLAQNNKATDRKALEALRASYARDPTDARMLRDLAMAYARSGDTGRASLATAERYAMLGRSKDALLHGQRAAGILPEGSVEWRRAMDIIKDAKRASKKG